MNNLNDLFNFKTELERKFEAATKSKIHYKQQWGRALRELSRIRQVQQEHARLQLQRQQQELEARAMATTTADQSSLLGSERKNLQGIQSEITRLVLLVCNSSSRLKQSRYWSLLN